MNIVLGVTGGIAAYKACDLCSMLKKQGHDILVVQTKNSTQFVGTMTFEGLSGRKVLTGIFDDAMDHIHWAKWADIIIVAPLSANALAKLSHGFCDDILSTLICATPVQTPILLCPAMNTHMWLNPMTQRNLAILEESKRYNFLLPIEKRLACGDIGVGGLVGVEEIQKECYRLCPQNS